MYIYDVLDSGDGGREMPIDREELIRKGKPMVNEVSWRRYEHMVVDYLKERFQQNFAKGKIVLGKPREFDAVGEDGEILVQIKYTGKSPDDFSDQQKRHYFADYMLDALKLERAPGTRRILIIYPDDQRKWFVEESRGLISPEIEVLTVPLEGEKHD